MKTLLIAAALLAAPLPVLAQSVAAGTVPNSFDARYVSGGSSSGSAVAVALVLMYWAT